MLSATSSIELEFFIKFLQSQHHYIWTLEGAVRFEAVSQHFEEEDPMTAAEKRKQYVSTKNLQQNINAEITQRTHTHQIRVRDCPNEVN